MFLRAMSTNSLFLPHKVMYHIAVAKCYLYVIHSFMWKKKGIRRHSPETSFFLASWYLEELKDLEDDDIALGPYFEVQWCLRTETGHLFLPHSVVRVRCRRLHGLLMVIWWSNHSAIYPVNLQTRIPLEYHLRKC